LWDDVVRGGSDLVSPLERVRIDVRDPALEPLADLVEGYKGDVCIISK
jgi:hypothetical protein